MISVLSKKLGIDLRDYGVSLISVEGLNFDSFMPLFGKSAIKVPVAVITDADPQKVPSEDGSEVAHYPALGESIALSDNAMVMKGLEDEFVKVFCGVKTFEYDFALHEKN